jgi:hypothetical protein
VGNVVANIAKGRAAYYSTLPAANDALILILLKSTGLQSDDALMDYDTVFDMLAASNDEADFTNYLPRKAITAVTVTVDDINNRVDVDFADQTWTAAGGATNNTLGKAVVAYDPDTTAGTDTTLIPLTYHDFSATTDGNDLVAVVAAAGFYRAA